MIREETSVGTTPRLSIPYPELNDGADVPLWIKAVADSCDHFPPVSSGLFSDRPVSTPVTPGIRDRLYWATDIRLGYWDTGTGWDEITGSIKDLVIPVLPSESQHAALAGTGGSPDDTNRYVTSQDSRLADPEPWQNTIFASGVSALPGLPPAQYRKVHGRVFIRGWAQLTAQAAFPKTLFTLPAGYRPSALAARLTYYNVATDVFSVILVTANVDGSVKLNRIGNNGPTVMPTTSNILLDGLDFWVL